MDSVIERPVLGHGLASALPHVTEARSQGQLTVASASSHNLFLEIPREAGIVGLGILIAAFASARIWTVGFHLPALGYLVVSSVTMPTSGLPAVVFMTWIGVMSGPVINEPTSAPYPSSREPAAPRARRSRALRSAAVSS